MRSISIFLVLIMLLTSQCLSSHQVNYNRIALRHWTLDKEARMVDGSFVVCKEGQVLIEDEQNNIVKIPFGSLSEVDRQYVQMREEAIAGINHVIETTPASASAGIFQLVKKLMLALLVIAGIGIVVFLKLERRKFRYIIPVLAVGVVLTLYSFTAGVLHQMKTTTSPATMDSAFAAFKPNVKTRWDATYFYVESKGIPTTHEMMKGITGWQQQVPIPQCYIGNNAWSIPLNPVMATTPVPVNQQHFLRGAIAVAVNGVAIFNPYTNTGVDAFLDGQLDIYGGHCGRADDYHYHIAPLSLYSYTSAKLPIAYALDGFAVYGDKEPDGTNMLSLDANHGHLFNGVYHYHGSSAAPYMIGNMVGKVTEDTTLQIIPQASASPVRPALTPLKGAVITGCRPNATGNGYTVIYTLSGATDSVVYSWTPNGVYTFDFYTASGHTTSTHNGFKQCTLPSGITPAAVFESNIKLLPNPVNEKLQVQLGGNLNADEVSKMEIFDLSGKQLWSSASFQQTIETRSLLPGTYILKMTCYGMSVNKKFMVVK